MGNEKLKIGGDPTNAIMHFSLKVDVASEVFCLVLIIEHVDGD